MNISMIIPVYNEEEILKKGIYNYRFKLRKLFTDFEIIIVNDGSKDKTGEIADNLASKLKEVKVVHHQRNLGVGMAILNGYKKATKDWVFTNPIDEPFDILDIKKFKNLFSQVDVIVVARTDRSANPFFRKITSIINYFFIKLLFGTSIHDFQFIQFYKRKNIEKMKIDSTDTFVPPEILLRSLNKSFKISEVKAVFHKRYGGESKYYSLSRYIKTIKEMLKFWIKFKVMRKR